MKTGDITDAQVVEACRRWNTSTSGMTALGHLLGLTGAPRKVALRAMERADRRGLIDWGTTISCAWPTGRGLHLLREAEALPLPTPDGPPPHPANG